MNDNCVSELSGLGILSSLDAVRMRVKVSLCCCVGRLTDSDCSLCGRSPTEQVRTFPTLEEEHKKKDEFRVPRWVAS